MDKTVAIVGAGVCGLLACKYTLEKGFKPIVFEADGTIGGVWAHTLHSTALQSPKAAYTFSDYPWPNHVKDVFPTNYQMMEYLDSYAKNFNVYPCIKFNSKVISIDYDGESYEEIGSWHLWGSTGKPFGSKGRWQIKVEDVKSGNIEVYRAEFVILCLGQFSGVPNIPTFPPGQGSEVFHGKVLHSMEYAAMNRTSAEELVKNKRVAVIGSAKSAIDLASHCADINGSKYPCTIVQRTANWLVPFNHLIALFYLNRLAGFLVHKPCETFLLAVLATLLSPLRWFLSKLLECYLKWKHPLKKFGMIPKHSFAEGFYSGKNGRISENVYEQLEEGSIVIKNSPQFWFSEEGLIIDGETKPLETDVVIFATGYNGDQKLKTIFSSPIFQKYIMGSPTSILPLYRHVIHPRIPRLAVLGYAESLSNLTTFEIRCQWLAQLLDERMELPSIKEMEEDVGIWDKYIKQTTGKYYRRSSIAAVQIWYNDQLCKDMGCNPKRKKGILAELIEPYSATDYANLTLTQG